MGLYILAFMFVAGGALFAYLGYSQVVTLRRQLATWIRAEGTVVDLVARPSSGGRTLYAPQYRCAFLGLERTITSDTAASPPDYAVGDTIRLVVNPEKTDESAVIDRNTFLFSYGLLALGLGVAIMGLLVAWLVFTGRLE